MIFNKKFNLTIYTILHFLVDLSCIFYLNGMVFVRLPSGQSVTAAILYNACAFALPILVGYFSDLIRKNAWVSALGCILVMIPYLILMDPWMATVVIGVGNGLFHIGGGRQVLQDSWYREVRPYDGENMGTVMSPPSNPYRIRFAPSGIFICSGALGVYLGRAAGQGFRQIYFQIFWICMALSALLLLYCGYKRWAALKAAKLPEKKQGIKGRMPKMWMTPALLLGAVLVFLVVLIRSYYGFAASFSWNNTFLIGLIFTLCVVAGKCLGGILADKVGVLLASLISLGGAGILALFSENSPVIGCIMILLFNMTMAITLSMMAEFFPQYQGFAFGALMLALFLGTLPNMLWGSTVMFSSWGMFGMCMISLVLLAAGIMTRDR